MGEWIGGEWRWKLSWNRVLRDREQEQVHRLSDLLSNYCLSAGKSDVWKWKATSDFTFSVKSAYKAICLMANPTNTGRKEKEMLTIWKAPAPLKAVTTSWKLFKGRLPTCDNLLKRQVPIQNSEALCVRCKLKEETIEHTFFACQNSDDIWKKIIFWLGQQSVLHRKVKDHYNAFTNLGKKENQRFLRGVWICTTWVLWKERNECKFNQGKWNGEKLFAEIKSRLWGWKMTYKMSSSTSDFRNWFLAAFS
ncbi:uncharacterized protein LOC131023114 [Salvia miltiorrhiza]|uniref:uncharacterized protein LOC131023114 n=1 Tax=Salvia miltiorrhiza TaxID=226208 RepID=UPI0025AD43E8|nr:uncharacterized protein LOC131023114 [Salvia miltiorrhiza]